MCAEPMNWLEAIHPDDRDRVRQAAHRQQLDGEFNEEYRIVRPDKSIRWIHDRAFPIRDGTGKVYRVAGLAEDITQRRHAEETLQLQAEITQNMEEGVLLVRDSDGTILYANPKLEQMFGYEPGELNGKPVSVLSGCDLNRSEEIASDIVKSLNKSGRWSGEFLNRRKDNTEIWTSATISRFEHPDHGCVRISVEADITERKRAEEAVRQSEKHLKEIMDNSPAVIYLKNAQGRYILINRRYEELFHVTNEQIAGMTDFEIFPKDKAAGFWQHDLQVLRAAQPMEFEEVAPHDDGVHTYISIKFPLFDAAGQPYAVCSISTDITERKRAEQALQTQARILENMAEGVLVYDDQDRIVFTNHAFDAMFGYGSGELVGQSTSVLSPLPPETYAETLANIRKHLQTHRSLFREFVNRCKDGSEFISESRISRLQIARQWCHVAILQDITQRKQLERSVIEISEREQSRIGQDLHDGLCQHLISTAFLANLLEQKLTEKTIAEAADAQRIAKLLDDAITQGRTIARGLHPVTVDEEGLTFALRELAINVSRLHGVSCQFECRSAVSVADNTVATHLFRIAQEAVNNAIRHARATEIGIELIRSANGLVTLKIADNGSGYVEPRDKPRGMGMAIMHYRARAIGGMLEIHPRADHGTIVVCSFRQKSV